MSEKGTYDVFVSYSSKNKNVADAIVADFEQHGIRCWYAPRDIMPGTSWVSAITDALRMVKVQVLIYTDESNTSRQVMNEVALAFNEGKTIVPFRLSETRMSDEFEYYLSRVHWLDAVTKNLADNITQLNVKIRAGRALQNLRSDAEFERTTTRRAQAAALKAQTEGLTSADWSDDDDGEG